MKFIFTTFLLVFFTSDPVASILNRGNGAEPDSLNIHLAQGINSHNILLDMYEGLMTFDAAGNVVNGAIDRYQTSESGLLWTFHLKSGLKWSDGVTLDAQNFIFAWQQAVKPETAAPYRHLFENLTTDGSLNVSAVTPQILQVQLHHPDAGFLNKLVLPIFYPLPKHTEDISVSNGAYYLAQWQLQEKISLLKNPYFHAAKQVAIKKVHYWVTENQNSELLRFRAGELDLTETIPDNKIDWLRTNHPNELKISPYFGTFFLGLNLTDSHLKNRLLRQALSAAIDRDILVNKVLKSGQRTAQHIIPGTTSVNKDPLFDLDKAKNLLKKSGFKVESEQLEILYNNSDNQKKVALAVAAMWRQHLGIKTKLKNQEWKMFVLTRKTSKKQVFRSGWIADYFDPVNFLELFQSNSHFNFYAFKNQEYDEIIVQLNQAITDDERQKLINQAENILAEALPVIPLYHYVSRHLLNHKIIGYQDNMMDKHLSRYLRKK